MQDKTKPQRKKTGFPPFLPLLFALPGVVLSILGLLLPFAARVTKNPYTGKIVREAMTVSKWGEQHDGMREISGDGFAFFSAARGFAWAIAVAAGVLLLLLVLSRVYPRSSDLRWTTAVAGVLLVLASVMAFVFACLFSISASGEEIRVLLSTAPYLTLCGGAVVGISAFLAVRHRL